MGSRKVIVPKTSRPTTSTPDRTPAQDPNPTPTWLSCHYCSRFFISNLNVRGVVVQAREPNTSYYVADYITNTYRPDDGLIISEWITAENGENNLALTRIYCDRCRLPAGWKVLQRSQTHPIVDVGHVLLPVTPPAASPSQP
ncbi:hypothetical protein AAG906_007894 [Vitis piasezkii]